MSVRRDGDVIRLEGDCHVEDAERLLRLLQESATPCADLSQCRALHGAVLQVLLSFRTPIIAQPVDPAIGNLISSSFGSVHGAEASSPSSTS